MSNIIFGNERVTILINVQKSRKSSSLGNLHIDDRQKNRGIRTHTLDLVFYDL